MWSRSRAESNGVIRLRVGCLFSYPSCICGSCCPRPSVGSHSAKCNAVLIAQIWACCVFYCEFNVYSLQQWNWGNCNRVRNPAGRRTRIVDLNAESGCCVNKYRTTCKRCLQSYWVCTSQSENSCNSDIKLSLRCDRHQSITSDEWSRPSFEGVSNGGVASWYLSVGWERNRLLVTTDYVDLVRNRAWNCYRSDAASIYCDRESKSFDNYIGIRWKWHG